MLFPYVIIAAAAGIAGGILAFYWAPGIRARSALQHFAAGVVIAAVASELIPTVERTGTTLGILGGFAAGGAVMIALKWIVLKFERREKAKHRLPVGLATAAAVDTLIDGAIISAGFSMGERLGSLLAAALGLELFFLTLAVGSEFHKKRSTRWKGLAVTVGIALLLPLGATGGFFALKGASQAAVAVALAFSAAALLYLIAEELLVESIQAEESLFSTAMLFAGFAALLALKLSSQGDYPLTPPSRTPSTMRRLATRNTSSSGSALSVAPAMIGPYDSEL
jgi:ZIP family zinc transporter